MVLFLILEKARVISMESLISVYLDFNPANLFSLYHDKVALVHSNSDSPPDYLFPSLRKSSSVLHCLDNPVSYQVLLKQFKISLKEVGIKVGLSKVGLHSMRRGGITHAVRAGAPQSVVKKCRT